MSNKNHKKKNNNYKPNANKAAEEQLKKIQAGNDKNLAKASATLMYTALVCLFAFIGLVILKLTGVIDMNWWLISTPIIVLIVTFIGTLFIATRSLLKQGMLNPDAIRVEEAKKWENKMKNNQKYQDAKSKYHKDQKIKNSKYKNIK